MTRYRMGMESKPCKRCGGTERYADGKCKACVRARRRGYDAVTNPEKNRARCKAWRAANPEKSRACSKAWKIANPEKDRARHAASPEKRAMVRAWYVANPEKYRAAAIGRYRKRRMARNLDELNFIFSQILGEK